MSRLAFFGSVLGVILLVCWFAQAQPMPEGQAESSGAPFTYALEGAVLHIEQPDGSVTDVEIPCYGLDLTAGDEVLYVACGEAGLLVLSVESAGRPEVLGMRDLGGAVTGLFTAQGRIWAEVSRIEARPVETGIGVTVPPAEPVIVRPSPPEGMEPPPEPTRPVAAELAEPVTGEILEVRAGEVLVSLGSEQGLQRSDHIELYLVESIDIGAGEAAMRERRIAVGEVTALTETRAQVELGMNERIEETASARPTTLELTSNNWLPPRVDGLWEVGFMARPFLALGTKGVGMVSDVNLTYRFREPVAVEAIIDPLGLGLAEEGNIVSLAGNVFASYDTEVFQVGLGLGWTIVNDELGGGDELAADRGEGLDLEFDEVKSGLSIAQIARLGARDGLHLLVYNNFVLHEDEFNYGGTRGTAQIPLPTGRTRTWLLVRGGGGRAGYAFGEVGLRVLLHGNGDRGSLFVTPSIGGAYLQGQIEEECEVWDPETEGTVPGTCTRTIDYGGPMVGFGMEWRF